MNLFPKLKKNQTGHVGFSNEPQAGSLFGDLTPLTNMIKPMRSRMAEYDHAIHALAVARERLRDLADAPLPDMALTVQRELIVAMGDSAALVRFDAEHNETTKAELQAREAAERDRTELPARIKALESLVRGIAQKMVDADCVCDIEQETKRVFEPYAQRLMAAASQYVEVLQAAKTAAHTLEQAVYVREYDLFASYRHKHQPELFAEFKEGILPDTLAGIAWDDIRALNDRVKGLNQPLSTRMQHELEANGLAGDTLRIYFPPSSDDPRGLYAPQLTRRVRRPPDAVPPGSALV